MDPILTLAQFLLAGTTVFFGYESVRLRGITTDQARRSAFFDDDQVPDAPRSFGGNRWDDDYDQIEAPERRTRRFKSRDVDSEDEDRFAARRLSRTIPESASSRRRSASGESSRFDDDIDSERSMRLQRNKAPDRRRSSFGERRRIDRNEVKKGSRPLPNKNTSRVSDRNNLDRTISEVSSTERTSQTIRAQSRKNNVEDASFTQKNTESKRSRPTRRSSVSVKSNSKNQSGRYSVGSKKDRPRDNSSRFDD